jgi:hypothetical protein
MPRRTYPAPEAPCTPEGRRRLEAFLTPVRRHYTYYGLGAPEEPNAISGVH